MFGIPCANVREMFRAAQPTVLLVDDEPLILDVCGALLRKSGYQALCCRNGRSGLETFERHIAEIQLLVSDVLMPDMPGTEMAQRMQSENPALRVVFMSGYGLDSRAESAGDRSVVLAKPFTSEQFLGAIRLALSETTFREPMVLRSSNLRTHPK